MIVSHLARRALVPAPQGGRRSTPGRRAAPGEAAAPAAASEVPRLPRPVLLIPGGKSQEKGLLTVLRALTRGRHNRFGGTCNAERPGELEQKLRQTGGRGNLFTLQYRNPFGSIETNAREVARAVDDIRRLTGAGQIDVVAECKGALEVRQYVHEGGSGVRNLVLLTPPNHGFPIEGDVAALISKLPLQKFRDYPLDPEGRRAMASFKTDLSLAWWHNNSLLAALNSDENVAREKLALHSITVLSGDGNNLFERYVGPGLPLPFLRGDNQVPVWSAFLPHARNFFYAGDRTYHTTLNSNPHALGKLTEALLTDGAPSLDDHYRAEAQPVGQAMAEGSAWLTTLVGRVHGVVCGLAGSTPGPAGFALELVTIGLLSWDAARSLGQAVRGTAAQGPARATLNGLAKLAQVAGLGVNLAGLGWPAAAIIAGGFAVSTLTN